MRTIAVVGCGFVGSIFTTEFLKRLFAAEFTARMLFIDSDTIELRNVANQNFLPAQAGESKAIALQQLALQYDTVQAAAVVSRLTIDSAAQVLDPQLVGSERFDLIVDGVDNLETRQLLWTLGMNSDVPVLHLGISEMATGKVEWSHPEHDTFSLSPARTAGKAVRDPAGPKPPCELVRMRGVGLNTGLAAAVAASLYFGFDPEKYLEGRPSEGWVTEWGATPTGHFPIKETWELLAPTVGELVSPELLEALT